MRAFQVKGGLFLAFSFIGLVAACGGVSANPPIGGDDGGNGSSSGGSSSGTSSSGGASSSSSSGGSSGSSSSGGTTKCPSSPPATGATCKGSLECEYGGDQDIQCDTVSTCTGGQWATSDAPTDGECPTSSPGTNGCPSSYGQVPKGQPCSGSTECAYPQGRCACTIEFGPVLLDDAGASWVCEDPETGCPEPRPQLGAACSKEGLTCDYGTCTLPGGTQLACTNGAWAESPAACAGVAH